MSDPIEAPGAAGRVLVPARRRPVGHRLPLYSEEAEVEFLRHVDKDGPLVAANPSLGRCWLWTGTLDAGYASFRWNRKSHRGHRWAYRHWVGAIRLPHLDHICHSWATAVCPGGPTCKHRACVNPEHLEPVSARENARRASRYNPYVQTPKRTMWSHCPNGHRWSDVTTGYDSSGRRICLDCVQGFY